MINKLKPYVNPAFESFSAIGGARPISGFQFTPSPNPNPDPNFNPNPLSGFQEPASFDTLVQTESDGVEMHDLEPAMADSPLPGAAQQYGLQKGM